MTITTIVTEKKVESQYPVTCSHLRIHSEAHRNLEAALRNWSYPGTIDEPHGDWEDTLSDTPIPTLYL